MPAEQKISLTAWNNSVYKFRVLQGESKSRNITISVVDADGSPVDLSGFGARLYVQEASGRNIFTNASISENNISCQVPMMSSPGRADAQIVLTKSDSEMLKLSGISFDVIPSDLEGSIDTSDDWSAIAAIIGDADQAIDAANSAAENANTVAQTVQDKLDNGELKGEPGESGTINDTTVTTFEGLLKGSGGKVAAAVAGEDYVTPSQLETDVFKLIYPVGSIYLSVNSANPSSVFPGTTWVAWGAGRVPVGVSSGDADFGSVEKTGGAKSVALNSSQVPTSTVNTFLDIYDAFSPAMTENSSTNYGTVAYLKDRNQGTVTGTVAGGSQAHSNLQPYITCYMWKRTA